MRSILLTSALLLLLGPAGVSAQDASVVAQSLGDRIDTHSVPSSGDVAFGRAVAVIEAPVDRVMEVVTDYARYESFLPHFRSSRVLARRGNNAMVYMQASVARDTIQLWAQLRIFERRTQGQTRIIEGRMTDGNMDAFVARWEVTPIDEGRTLVVFRLLVDPSIPVPSSLVTDENVKNARRALRAVRERVEQRT